MRSHVGVMKELSILLETDEDRALFDEVMDGERFDREHGEVKRVADIKPGDMVCAGGVLREAILNRANRPDAVYGEILRRVLWRARGVHLWRVGQVWPARDVVTLMFDTTFALRFPADSTLPVACATSDTGLGTGQ